MNKNIEKILRQDLFKLQAEFLLGEEYLKIRDRFMCLCELGLLEALELYYSVHDVGENQHIDRIVDSFPECDENGEYSSDVEITQVGNGFVLNSPEMDDFFSNRSKAMIKFYREKNRDLPRGDLSRAFFDKIAEFPKSCDIENGDKYLQTKINNAVSSGSDWCIVFTSIQSILYNGRITPQIGWLLNSVANQSHSDVLLNYQINKALKNIEKELNSEDVSE